MTTKTAVHVLLATMVLASASTARANDATKPKADATTTTGVILSAGLGASPGGIMGTASAQLRRGRRLFGLRLAESSEFNLFGPSPALSDSEFGVLYGRYTVRRSGFVTAAAGLSMVRSVRRGRSLGSNCNSSELFGCLFAVTRYEKIVTRTIAVPFEVRAVLSARNAGLGLGLFGSLSPGSTFVGVALTLDVGLLR